MAKILYTQNLPMGEDSVEVCKITHDANGNPRYVLHFLSCEPESWVDYSKDLTERYARVVQLMNRIGGRKYHCRLYGGGIVFQSYNMEDTLSRINALKQAA